MMILADLTADFKHDSEKGNYYQTYDSKAWFIGFKVALRYDLAKLLFCLSGSDTKEYIAAVNGGGMTHGHMVGTYYFLANDYKNKLEEKQ